MKTTVTDALFGIAVAAMWLFIVIAVAKGEGWIMAQRDAIFSIFY